MTSIRGLVLKIDDGDVYALDTDPGAQQMLGRRVTIEGLRNGFDRIHVQWMGLAEPSRSLQ